MVDLGRYCGFKVTQVRRPGDKLMFVEGGDFWMQKRYANYKISWDKWGEDIQTYRRYGMWGPTFYRHSEGANIAFFDGHTEYLSKEKVFFYYEGGALAIHISTIGFGSLFLLTGAGAKNAATSDAWRHQAGFNCSFQASIPQLLPSL